MGECFMGECFMGECFMGMYLQLLWGLGGIAQLPHIAREIFFGILEKGRCTYIFLKF